MKKKLFLFGYLLFMSSCVTMFNGPNSPLDIHTSEPATIIVNKDTFDTENNKVEFILERRKRVVEVVAFTDSITKVVKLEPKLSPGFYMNFIWPYAFIFERNKERAYVYPKSIFINMVDTFPLFYSHFVPEKSELYFNVYLPYINNFLFQPINDGFRSRTGLLGLGLGFEYHYKKNRFWSFNVEANTDGIIPAGRKNEEFYAVAVSFSINHRHKRNTYGYGLAYALNFWNTNGLTVESPSPLGNTLIPLDTDNKTLGGRFSIYRQLKDNFYFGLVYRPTIFQVEPVVKFKYEQVISVDFAWKLKWIIRKKINQIRSF